jgi:mycothiol synthase
MPLPQGYTLRPARLDDAAEVVQMLNEESEALIGVALVDLHWVTKRWSAPDADRHVYEVLTDSAGAIVAYLDVESHPPHTEVFGIGSVALAHHGRGLGAAVVEVIEMHAEQLAGRAAAGDGVALRMGALADEPRASALLRQHGYAEVRRFSRMRIDFDGPPDPPAVMDGVEIRQFEHGQEGEVFRCLHEAFEDHWGDEEDTEEGWIHRQMAEDRLFPDLWLLAWQGSELAGALTARPVAVQEPTHGFVGELGVRRAFRGRGIGEALLRESFVRFYGRGCLGAVLVVDSDSPTGANRLYERVGMTVTPQFAIWEKELVPAT